MSKGGALTDAGSWTGSSRDLRAGVGDLKCGGDYYGYGATALRLALTPATSRTRSGEGIEGEDMDSSAHKKRWLWKKMELSDGGLLPGGSASDPNHTTLTLDVCSRFRFGGLAAGIAGGLPIR